MIIHEMKKHEHLPNSDVYNIIGVLMLVKLGNRQYEKKTNKQMKKKQIEVFSAHTIT